MQQLTYPIRLAEIPVVWRGDPFDWILAMAGGVSDDGTLLDAKDIRGFGTSWAAVAKAGAKTVVFDVDATNAAFGFVVLSLTGEQTRDLDPRKYVFDVQASGGVSSPFTVWVGAFDVDRDFTP